MTIKTADEALAADFKGEAALLERLRRESAPFRGLVAKHHALFLQMTNAPANGHSKAEFASQREHVLDEMAEFVIEAEEEREDRTIR